MPKNLLKPILQQGLPASHRGEQKFSLGCCSQSSGFPRIKPTQSVYQATDHSHAYFDEIWKSHQGYHRQSYLSHCQTVMTGDRDWRPSLPDTASLPTVCDANMGQPMLDPLCPERD